MTERVSTGGLMSFDYKNGPKSKLSDEQKKEISEAYEKYYERKAREKKRKNILIGIIIVTILIIIVAGIYFFR